MVGAYYRTVRRTRWSQLLWRARYALERRRRLTPGAVARWQWPGTAAPALRPDFPDVPLGHRTDTDAVDLLQRGIFRHLNQAVPVGRARPDWRLGPAAVDRLWTVTLHYHGWAYDLAEAGATDLLRHYVGDWMTRCAVDAPGSRSLAWNAYAVATRLTWWIRAYRAMHGDAPQPPDRFADEFLGHLWQQAAYLHDHLEWDLRANHLLRDAVGLAWAGRFFAEPPARTWLATATALAREQAAEQVLADGGHFERSPMYHLHVMEDLLALALLVEDEAVRSRLRATWAAMAEYLAWVRHPDGDIPLFNDAALGGACAPGRMLELGARLGIAVDARPRRGGRLFPQTGLAVWHGTPWSVFLDVGAVGPDYQPGHAHADTLAVECSYRGRRLFVDPGTGGYDLDERRRYDRSTAAHNTVAVDGRDSSEVWHIFRVGRRADPVGVQVDASADALHATAAHTGYDHLPGRPRHRRTLAVRDDGPLTLTDRIDGHGRHAVRGGFLLAPGWTAAPASAGWVLTNGPDSVRVTVRGPAGMTLAVAPARYHPEFGREVEVPRLTWQVDGELPVEIATQVEPT